jgi:hypothetical protein
VLYRGHLRVNCGKSLPFRYLPHMEMKGVREVEVLASARRNLQDSGKNAYAELVTAVWEVCYGGCGFNMTDGERAMSCEVSKLLFCDPSYVRMMIAQASRNVSDQTLRDELRKLSKSSLGRQ